MLDTPFPAYGDEPYIFVSYAHADEEIVYAQIQWLRDQGFNVWYGEVSEQEQAAFTQTWLADPAIPTPLLIFRDNRKLTSLSTSSVKSSAHLARLTEVPEETRLAMLVDEDLQYGMSRMYQSLVDEATFSVQVFRDQDEAIMWLNLKFEL